MTHNLFWGRGETDHRLEVIEGHWPDDLGGAVHIVGPDKRRPGGHWFGEHGLLCRIDGRPDPEGRVVVRHRRVRTRVDRLRRWLPFLFGRVAFLELSPFGVTNFANTNVQGLDDRLFVGYDAGRPIEVDPDTLDVLTPVGANDEWLQGLPGLVEPLVAVAAHPAPDHEEHALWFVNYQQLPDPDGPPQAYVARWGLDGPVERWRLDGMTPFDSIHDIKATRDYLVFCDLPFAVEPESFQGAPRSRPNEQHTTLRIVAKADLRRTPPGGSVPVREVRVDHPTGHLSVDYENPGGELRVFLQHIPLADLMISVGPDEVDRHGNHFDPNYEGLIAGMVQPGLLGRYRIDADRGEVLEADLASDVERFWGPVLATQDAYTPAAIARQRQLVFAGMGFDPDLIPETWWRLYGDATDAGVVAPNDLPAEARPGSLARFDLESMKVDEVFAYDGGAFPSPPTFVPRARSTEPDDGYVVVVVHKDPPKEVQVFDARHLERGPLARATAPDFNPPLLLHSTWMPPRTVGRRSDYRVPLGRDVRGAVRQWPHHIVAFVRLARAARAGKLG